MGAGKIGCLSILCIFIVAIAIFTYLLTGWTSEETKIKQTRQEIEEIWATLETSFNNTNICPDTTTITTRKAPGSNYFRDVYYEVSTNSLKNNVDCQNLTCDITPASIRISASVVSRIEIYKSVKCSFNEHELANDNKIRSTCSTIEGIRAYCIEQYKKELESIDEAEKLCLRICLNKPTYEQGSCAIRCQTTTAQMKSGANYKYSPKHTPNSNSPSAPAPTPTQTTPVANSQWPNMRLTFAQSEAQNYASQATDFLNNWITSWNNHDVSRLTSLVDNNVIYLLGKIYTKSDYQSDMQRRFSKHPQARQMPSGDVFINFIKTNTDKYLSFEFTERFTNDGNKESTANKMIIAKITPNGLRMVHESDDATDFNVEVKTKLVPDKSLTSCKSLIYKIVTTSPAYHVDWMSKPESKNGVETNDFTNNGSRSYSLTIETRSSDGNYPNEFNYDINLNSRTLHFSGGFNALDVTVKIDPRWDSDLRRLCP